MSQGERNKTSKTKDIPFHLHRGSINHIDKLGSADLEMPADIGQKNWPTLYFNLMDEDDKHSLEIMRTLCHPNILHVWALNGWEDKQGDKSFVAAYVDRVTGLLSNLLTPCRTEIKFGSSELVFPSFLIQDLVSQIADGLDFLRENEYYHGNLSLETTCYWRDASGYTIKLSHFERKGHKDLEECQKDDWASLGEVLDVIARIAKLKPFNQLDFCLIDDLSRKLKSFAFSSLKTVKNEVKGHPFFWDSRRRKMFYTSEVPCALSDTAFIAKIKTLKISLPWNADKYDGYLVDMDKYRLSKGWMPYKGTDKEDYVKCISGLYTHEIQLKSGRPSVDAVVQSRNAKLCMDLQNAMS